jgi:hypothetical protein
MFVMKLTQLPSGEKLGANAEPMRAMRATWRAMVALRPSVEVDGTLPFDADGEAGRAFSIGVSCCDICRRPMVLHAIEDI